MNDAAPPSAATSRSETSAADGAPADAPLARPGGRKTLVIATVGGLITAALLVGAVSLMQSGKPGTFGLQTVATADITDAATSLNAAIAGTATDDARQCKVPLAFVTLSMTQGSAVLRIRSGTYVSPDITLTEAPRRVAVPFPAAYPTGKGVISIEGNARGVNVWLTPGRHLEALNGIEAIPVVWTPKDPPC
jgi:hypothetical protein